MNKKLLIIFCILILTGCQNNKTSQLDTNYIEKSKTYDVGEEKVIIEYVPEKPAYTEKKLSGKTTSWGLKTRYEVGKDLQPGAYYLTSTGWAEFNIFIGAVEVNLNNTKRYSGSIYLEPTEQSVCYIHETNCPYGYYKKIGILYLEKGDIIYASYSPHNDQWVNLRFEAQYINIEHPKEEEIPEVKVNPLQVKESIRKYSNNEYKCYINDYEVPNCSSLNYYDELIKEFD